MSLLLCDVCNRYPTSPSYELYVSDKGGSYCAECKPLGEKTVKLPIKYVSFIKKQLDENTTQCSYCKVNILGIDGLEQHRTFACPNMYVSCACGATLLFSELYAHVKNTHQLSKSICSDNNKKIDIVITKKDRTKYGFVTAPSTVLFGDQSFNEELLYAWMISDDDQANDNQSFGKQSEDRQKYLITVWLYNYKQNEWNDNYDKSRTFSVDLEGKTYESIINKCPCKKKQYYKSINVLKEELDRQDTITITITDLILHRVQ